MSKLRTVLHQLLLLLLVTVTYTAQASPTSPSNSKIERTRAKIVNRVQRLDLPLKVATTDDFTDRKINEYLELGHRSTERMLGRANQYFPVFEYYLRKHQMPVSLKYLAVSESMLVPGAVSPALAAGLWQLMPATAREMGLRVDSIVDERLDLYRSTEAAVLMLKRLHEEFGDWHLALAAYNCGNGRVRKGIRLAGSKQYVKVKGFLPQETQRYVAAYVAAAYAVNYYGDHGLIPHELEGTDYVMIHRYMNLAKIARECDVRIPTLRRLNPNFVRGYVPSTVEGYRLRVPSHKKQAVQLFLWGRPNLVELPRNADLPAAHATAAMMGYDAQMILLGVSSERLVYDQPDWTFQSLRDGLLMSLYDSYQALV
ncbi:membrane-bound lytic murein transglycosylase D [Neolewinella xylanilytica]|uniref:Membrane-bound lytic murein transglycosylase D n=1 Tax=Neolewinella xylanilytica TaxID=1514080 RepID=A0A2S6I814_9BACT|nr:lytic transglycosylase domain-containing protein [Neolewinella xylanilytica]PPK87631.1 membrane-bound lytic murein transglycosylase D [Neolewinella xylanilytica]